MPMTEPGSNSAEAQRFRPRGPDACPAIVFPEVPEDLPVFWRADGWEMQGPVSLKVTDGFALNAACVKFLDAYSLFDWGRMPDGIAGKAAAEAILAHHLLERLEKPELWGEFSRGVQALALRKGNRFGAAFNEVGEILQAKGLRTHRLGLGSTGAADDIARMRDGGARLWIRKFPEILPQSASVLGRTLHAYSGKVLRPTEGACALPFEIRFQFRLQPETVEGSTLARIRKDRSYLERRGFRTAPLDPLRVQDFPVLELFTRHEPVPRSLELEEGLALAGAFGLQAEDFNRLLLLSGWVAGFLRQEFRNARVDLDSGVLRWARDVDGQPVLTALPGTEEFSLSVEGQRLNPDVLQAHYAGTPWAKSVRMAREIAEREAGDSQALGADEFRAWKKRVPISPKPLPEDLRDWMGQLYPSLTLAVTKQDWFPGAVALEAWVNQGRRLLKAEAAAGRGEVGIDARSN